MSDWIPCSDHNPPESGSYIITTKTGSVCAAHYYSSDDGYSEDRWAGRFGPVAWMPFPDPYSAPDTTEENCPAFRLLIRDNTDGRVFEYGSDCHHALEISGNGGCLTFANLHNGDGSSADGSGGYSFVLEDGKTPEESGGEAAAYGCCYADIGGSGSTGR